MPNGMLEREKSLLAGIGSHDLIGAMIVDVEVELSRRADTLTVN